MVKDRIRNYFYNPAFNNLNLGLFKEFRITEAHRFLFRAEGVRRQQPPELGRY